MCNSVCLFNASFNYWNYFNSGNLVLDDISFTYFLETFLICQYNSFYDFYTLAWNYYIVLFVCQSVCYLTWLRWAKLGCWWFSSAFWGQLWDLWSCWFCSWSLFFIVKKGKLIYSLLLWWFMLSKPVAESEDIVKELVKRETSKSNEFKIYIKQGWG